MPVTAEELKAKLLKELEAVHVEAVDNSDGCGGKFKVLVVSDKFEGKGILQRHRLVHGVLADELKEIHAFEQKTLTSAEWREKEEAQ